MQIPSSPVQFHSPSFSRSQFWLVGSQYMVVQGYHSYLPRFLRVCRWWRNVSGTSLCYNKGGSHLLSNYFSVDLVVCPRIPCIKVFDHRFLWEMESIDLVEINGQKPLRRLLHALQSQDPKRFASEEILQIMFIYDVIIIHVKYSSWTWRIVLMLC